MCEAIIIFYGSSIAKGSYMDLRIEKITGNTQDKQKIKDIYMSSFAVKDRMPFWMLLMVAKMKNTEFISFYDRDILCGFTFMLPIENLTYIMYLAVDETLRSKGYGSRILNEIQSMYPDNKIMLTIERCDEDAKNIEQRVKRKSFYLKNDYIETGYLQKLPGQKQEILIANGKFDKDEFSCFFKKYSRGLMKPKLCKKT